MLASFSVGCLGSSYYIASATSTVSSPKRAPISSNARPFVFGEAKRNATVLLRELIKEQDRRGTRVDNRDPSIKLFGCYFSII